MRCTRHIINVLPIVILIIIIVIRHIINVLPVVNVNYIN